VNNDFKSFKAPVANLMHFPGICVQVQRKATTKLSQDSVLTGIQNSSLSEATTPVNLLSV
jgi:hypothetical protein